MLISKKIIKNEEYEVCPLCGSKIHLIFKDEDEKEEVEEKKKNELDLINANDWILP
ncbi:MAG: hypothetical protein ACFE8A_10495 [Candidatus Hodarchaeota archaeon]